MKICFIGNSHLAPLAVTAHGVEPKFPNEQRKFYISRTYGKQPLKLVGANDVAILDMVKIEGEEASESTIFTEDWDHFVVLGFGFSAVSLIEGWKEYQPDVLPIDLGGQLLTPEVSASYTNHIIAQSQASRLITILRRVTDKPITLVPAPLPAEWAGTESGERLEAFHTFTDNLSEQYLIENYEAQKDRFISNGIRVVDQPEETKSGSIWTKTTFCLGQPDGPDERGFFERRDFYHMNKTFGK